MSLTFVSEQLLASNKLSHQDLFSILGQLAECRLDYADLYFQSSYHEAWVIEDGIIKDGSYNIDQGVGVRAVQWHSVKLLPGHQKNSIEFWDA